MGVIIWVLQNPCLVIGMAVLYVGFVGYVLIEISTHGDDHWVWIPIVIFVMPVGIPLYFICRLLRAKEERDWVERSIVADDFKRSHNPRKVKTEQELREAYHKSKAQKNR